MTPTHTRTPTPVDNLIDGHLDEYAALNPIFATAAGIPGHDAELPDLSPDWLAAVSALRQRTIAGLRRAAPVDANDRVTVAAATDEFTVDEQIRATGVDESRLNNVSSPVQDVRAVFDLMATSSADDWALIASRLARVPDSINGYVGSLRHAATRGNISPRRQVEAGIKQSRDNTGPDGFFATFAGGATTADGELPSSVRADVERGAQAAASAYEQLAAFLDGELLPQAPADDPVGRERYALFSRSFLGSAVDLDDAYAWLPLTSFVPGIP